MPDWVREGMNPSPTLWGTRSAEVSRAFQLPSGGGSHAAGPRSLGRDRLGLSTEGLGILFFY